MIRARFRTELPDDAWIAEVSREFPAATFRLVTGVPMGDRVLELGEIRMDDPEPAVAAVEAHPDISAYDLLYIDDERSIAQYEAIERRLYDFLWESSQPPEFPFVVENGAMEFDVTVTQAQFDAVGGALDASGFQYELLSVVHQSEGEDLLTERQREVVTTALREGYFAVPRECSLAELAATLDVDESTASVTLRRGTARIVDAFFLGQE